MRKRLTLRPLRALASLAKTWLLAFNGTGIALEKSGSLKRWAASLFHLRDSAGDSVTDGYRLSSDASSLHASLYLVVVLPLAGLEGIARDGLALGSLKVLASGLAVHRNRVLLGWSELHARAGGLATADCGDVGLLLFRHSKKFGSVNR